MVEKISSIGNGLSATNPEPNATVKIVFATAAKYFRGSAIGEALMPPVGAFP
jgi:hypothetical protein